MRRFNGDVLSQVANLTKARWWGPQWLGPLCLLLLFASVLLGRDRLAFRDVSYFYTPLYQYVDQRCEEQPWGALGAAIWNPLDQTGMPLAGETTTAVFYPLRILVYAPPWSAETAIGVYVLLHLLIASLAAYTLARRFRCDRYSASIAGVVYPLSGIVLFLSTNPPFLVGAAWLPWLLSSLLIAGDRRVIVPAVAMAMMILGGDPPTALHALIIAAAVQGVGVMIAAFRWQRQAEQRGGWIARARNRKFRPFFFTLPLGGPARFGPGRVRRWIQSSPSQRLGEVDSKTRPGLAGVGTRLPSGMGRLVRGAGHWIAIVALASLLAAPQIAASMAWSVRSDRVQSPSTEKISKTREQAYAFSVAPWRWVETAIPNCYSTPWPINTRWDRIVFDGGASRPETALWTPTLYCGIAFPFLLGYRWWTGWSRNRERQRRGQRVRWRLARRWQWYVILAIAFATSLGAYGPAYLVRSGVLAINTVFAQSGGSWSLPASWAEFDGKLGSPFWLLHEFLPGYDSLRYPSKWLPFAALAIAVLTAILIRDASATARRRRRRRNDSGRSAPHPIRALLLSGVVVCFLGVVLPGTLAAILRDTHPTVHDPFWGPFVLSAATRQLWFSGLHLSIFLLLLGWLRDKRWWVALIVVDLMIAHAGLVPRVDRERESSVLNRMAIEIPSHRRWMRLHHEGGFPKQWAERSQTQRMLFVEAGLRHAWFARWHLEHDQAIVNGLVSIGSREMAEFWHHARTLDQELGASSNDRWRRWCRLLGVEGFLHSGGSHAIVSSTLPSGVVPRVRWETFDKFCGGAVPGRECLRVHRRAVVLGSDRRQAWRKLLLKFSSTESEQPAFVSEKTVSQWQRARRQIAAEEHPMIVSRRVYQDGYWQAQLISKDQGVSTESVDVEVFNVDFLSQGVLVPPGRWRIEFRYAPWWHRPVLTVSMLGWAAVIVVSAVSLNRSFGQRFS